MDKENIDDFIGFLPSPGNFIKQISLYKAFEVNILNIEQIKDIINYSGPIDLFCKECNQESVFINDKAVEVITGYSPGSSQQDKYIPSPTFTPPDYFHIEFNCSRNPNHKIYFCFSCMNDKIQKIGQFPSYADLQEGKIKKYKKILGNNYYELAKAIGLVSHGIGIGSFVYLRRIFENLIEEEHLKSKTEENWDDKLYNSSKMDKRIKLLKDRLPNFLVANYSIYSILSKGIHLLSEDECLKYFQPIQLGIELILDEKLETIERIKKIKSAQKSIADIKTDINKRI